MAGLQPSSPPIRAGPHRRVTRTLMIRRSIRVGVRRGLRYGRQERSTIPSAPCCRYRSAHRFAVVGATWNRSAARRSGQPSSTTHRASRSLPVSVNGALRWGTRTSWVPVQMS